MKYNPDLHKRRSLRLKDYDYSSEGCYFVTICCAERKPIFGYIRDEQMYLNEYGRIAREEWLNTVCKRTGVALGEFIVMPNHVHGIVIFNEDFRRIKDMGIVKGVCDTPLRSPSYTLGAIIRGYKGAVTSRLKEQYGNNIWQRNYYEHIIRNEQSYDMIETYIMNNPVAWKDDRFFINT